MDNDLPQAGAQPVRPCSKCSMCCSVLAIEELEKPMWQRCSDLSPTRGCGRYETRPPACVKFECMWRYGTGPSRARPDKSGVIFILTPDKYGLVALVDGKRPDSWKKGGAKDVIDEHLAKGVPVFIASPKGKSVLMPTHTGLSADRLETMRRNFMEQDLD